MKTRYIYLLLLASLTLWRCEPVVDEFVPESGNADFSVFVSVGDSYSAGYIDGALSYEGQKYSFPKIIASQLASLGAGEFKQPMLPEGTSVGSSLNGSYVLKVIDKRLMPVPTQGNPELLTDPRTWINGEAPFNNVAVPGAKTYHLLAPEFGNPTLGIGNFNPYYARFASHPGISTVLGDAMLNDPTFFSLWIGGNDVLWYGLGGGTGSTSGMGAYDITPEQIFAYSVDKLAATLTSNGAKGVMCNIPDIDPLPYFSYIKYDDLVISADTAALLNLLYREAPHIEFKEGRNPFVMADKNAPGGMRQMVEGEKVLLSALPEILGDKHYGVLAPLPDELVLDLDELKALNKATAKFNEIIKQTADKYDLAFVDANSIMKTLMTGIIIDGVGYNTEFVSGGFFSLDGIHASSRGYAIIANEFIKAINAKYGSTVPMANVNDYTGVEFP